MTTLTKPPISEQTETESAPTQSGQMAAENISPKSRLALTLLAWILGGLGVDRFYLGKIGTGILRLITGGGFGIWWLIDFVVAVAGARKDKEGRPIKKW
jgi:hypothetical protein